jgi:Tol biopolymer transport system component
VNLRTQKTHRVQRPASKSDWAPTWSPDDRYIAFVRSAPNEPNNMGAGQIWVVPSDGTTPRSIGSSGTDISWVQ